MFKRGIIQFAAILVCLTLAAGCRLGGPSVGGVLVEAVVGNPNLFQPMLSSDPASGSIEALVFEGLVSYDEKMQRVGLLADRWDISEDQLEWTFYLKQGVKWHDGKPFTADDVAFTFRTIAFNPDYPGPRKSSYALLEEIEVIDEHTIKFILSRPYGPFMNAMGIGIVPRHLYDPQYYKGEGQATPISEMFRNPYNWSPVGTGPWVFDQWKAGESITLVRNENYHQRGLPFISTRVFKLFDNVTTAVEALIAGETDMQFIPTNMIGKVMASLGKEGDDSHNFFETINMAYDYLGFNHREHAFGEGNKNPWTDLKVRQAVVHAIDRQECIDSIYQGRGTIMHSSVPPVSWAYPGDDAITIYKYDPATAKRLLSQAGWVYRTDIESDYRWYNKGSFDNPDWQMFEFNLALQSSSPVREAIAMKTKDYLKEVGIKVNVEIMDWRVLLNHVVIPGNYHMVVMGWSLAADPDSYNIFHSEMTDALNDGAYSNQRVDRLLVLGRETVDIDTRKIIYAELQAELSHDLPYVFLFTTWNMRAVDKKVRGITLGAQGLANPTDWYLVEGKN